MSTIVQDADQTFPNKMPQLPTLHKPIDIGSKVSLRSNKEISGEIIGISYMDIIFTYIVLLESPIDTPHGRVRGISVSGTELDLV